MGMGACFCRGLIACEMDADVVVFVAKWMCRWEGGRTESGFARCCIGRRGRWLCIVDSVAIVAAMCRGKRSRNDCVGKGG